MFLSYPDVVASFWVKLFNNSSSQLGVRSITKVDGVKIRSSRDAAVFFQETNYYFHYFQYLSCDRDEYNKNLVFLGIFLRVASISAVGVGPFSKIPI